MTTLYARHEIMRRALAGRAERAPAVV